MSIGDRPNVSTPQSNRRDIDALQGMTPQLSRTLEAMIRDVSQTLPDATQNVGQSVEQLVLDTDAIKAGHFLLFQLDAVLPNGRLLTQADVLNVLGVLPISSGGTGASTASGARLSLGLGTIAVQNANAVVLTGGTVDGINIGQSVRGIGNFTAISAVNQSRVVASNTSAQSIPNNTFTTVGNWTAGVNIGANLNAATGVYTAPASTTYDVRAAISLSSATFAAGQIVAIAAFVNGVVQQQCTTTIQAAVTTGLRVNGAFRVFASAGDTITLQAFQNSGGAITLDGAAGRNFLSIYQDP